MSIWLLVLISWTPVALVPTVAHALRVKVVATFSLSPNDPIAEGTSAYGVSVGGKPAIFADDNVTVIPDVPAGAQLVTVDAEDLGDSYRVGSVVLTSSLTGDFFKCNPAAINGSVTVHLDAAAANPSAVSDYTVGVRIVPIDAEALEGGVDTCGNPGGGGGGGSCQAPQGLGVLATGQPPKITSVSVPPTGPADGLIPFSVSFSDPDADVILLILEEQNSLFGWDIKGSITLAPGKKDDTIGAATICENTLIFDESHTIRFTVADKECQSVQAGPFTYKCVTKPVSVRLEQAAGVAAAGTATFVASVASAPTIPAPLKISPPFVKGVAVASGLLWLTQAGLNIYNNDPPDPNFMILAEPALPPVPVLVAEETLTPDLAASFNGLFGNLAEFVGVVRALVTSLERAQGAAEAEDVFWFVQQTTHAADLAARWAELVAAYPDLAAGVKASWQAAGILETLTSDEAVSAQDLVGTSGFPSALGDVLEALGLTDAEVASLTDAVVVLDPERAAMPIPDNLATGEFTSALLELGPAIGSFAASLDPSGGCGSCDDGNPCTDDACQADSTCAHDQRPGVEGLACLVDRLLPAGCGTAPKGVTNGLAKAHTLADGALANPAKAAKLLLKARKILAKVAKAAAKAKKKSKLDAACADALSANIADLRGRIKSFASS